MISETHAKLGTFSTNGLGLGQSNRTSQEVPAVLREYKQSGNMTGEQNTAKQGPTQMLMIQGIVSVLMIQGIISVFMIQGIITIPTTTGFFQTPAHSLQEAGARPPAMCCTSPR